jgi:hypothetical protein
MLFTLFEIARCLEAIPQRDRSVNYSWLSTSPRLEQEVLICRLGHHTHQVRSTCDIDENQIAREHVNCGLLRS